jgi:pyruvate/2-oxoglutarate dehydrogenase complex dihydrolipoamide acyltransferase (E2) component
MGKDYQVLRFPPFRKLIVDFATLAKKNNTIYGMTEFDITETKKKLREFRRNTKQKLSLTAYAVSCIGKAVKNNPQMHGYLNWRNKLIVFNDVDLLLPVEIKINDSLFPVIHVFRAIDKKEAVEIEREINNVKNKGMNNREYQKKWNYIKWFLYLPKFIRLLFYKILLQSVKFQKKYFGTVAVTAVGMFGSGGGWGIGLSNHTLEIILGGVCKRAVMIRGRMEEREFLNVTISVDHDIIDGAPGARFARDLRHLLEDFTSV